MVEFLGLALVCMKYEHFARRVLAEHGQPSVDMDSLYNYCVDKRNRTATH
jgi:hypothetical protein